MSMEYISSRSSESLCQLCLQALSPVFGYIRSTTTIPIDRDIHLYTTVYWQTHRLVRRWLTIFKNSLKIKTQSRIFMLLYELAFLNGRNRRRLFEKFRKGHFSRRRTHWPGRAVDVNDNMYLWDFNRDGVVIVAELKKLNSRHSTVPNHLDHHW